MRSIQRPVLTALVAALAVTGSGCSMKWTDDGLCFKRTWRIHIEHDRNGRDRDAQDCNCVGGGDVIDGGVIDGGMIHGGGVIHGGLPVAPLTVETVPLNGAPLLHGAPLLPGADGGLLAENFLSSTPAPTLVPTPAS